MSGILNSIPIRALKDRGERLSQGLELYSLNLEDSQNMEQCFQHLEIWSYILHNQSAYYDFFNAQI